MGLGFCLGVRPGRGSRNGLLPKFLLNDLCKEEGLFSHATGISGECLGNWPLQALQFLCLLEGEVVQRFRMMPQDDDEPTQQ